MLLARCCCVRLAVTAPQRTATRLHTGRAVSFRKLLLPILDAPDELSAGRMQAAVATMGQTSSISAAIMGGVAAAGMLGYTGQTEGQAVRGAAGEWSWLAPELLPFPLSYDLTAALVLPMYSASFFINLHMLILGFLANSYVHTIPAGLVLDFTRRFAYMISWCGWLHAPALISLGFAMVCHIHQTASPAVAGLALATYAATGIVNTYYVCTLAVWTRNQRLLLKQQNDQEQH